MGQYYTPCVLNKKFNHVKKPSNIVLAAIYPHDWNNGAKLMEHSYVGNTFVRCAMQLIALHNGNPFVWCGDYADERFTDMNGEPQNAYMIAHHHMSPEELKEMCESNDIDIDCEYKYIVNYSKREYVKIPEYKEGEWTIHPLPLLCADGNGRGSGDAFKGRVSDFDLIGTWAYDRIGVTNKRPHYKRLHVNFVEDLNY